MQANRNVSEKVYNKLNNPINQNSKIPAVFNSSNSMQDKKESIIDHINVYKNL